jgi:cyclohexyl-isocyanide hydratase
MSVTSSSSSSKSSVGIVLFPNVTQLDVTGPCEVFARLPATTVHLVAAALEPIRSEYGLTILPDLTFDTVPPLDVICVPGGIGVNAAMEDEALLSFLRRQAGGARYVTSVCTGALVLGAAGLLQGYRATTHWLSLELLPLFGAHPVDRRVVVDRNRVTGGGLTAGIDLGLVMASELCGPAVAREIQVMIESDPVAPRAAGSLSAAPPDVVQRVVRTRQEVQADRRTIAERAAARLEHVTDGSSEKSLKGVVSPQASGHATLESFALRSTSAEGVDVTSLEPGTTLNVHTRNSQYRFVVLFDPSVVLVKGGATFPEATVVRLEGATAGGRILKMGWILVGFHMEMWLGARLVTSSRVCSISFEGVPPLRARAAQ